MASLIPGYEYDIFISYRQKDNKYDGWVTEFVDNLKRELESMFKDEVSVYFDINPSDYLLESYDVDASLKDKLKCLVFIPIISRTYCDPKAFAWDNELKAFVRQASEDRFGFKVKLPGGNVANRVLPVRIHDLDNADIRLFESAVGGVMRSIDFVYKETGVNRQLRAKDDDIIKSPNQILYRDQINKVALAIKEIIESIRIHSFSGKEIQSSDVEGEKENKAEKPGISEREEAKVNNENPSDFQLKKKEPPAVLKRSKMLIPAVILIVVIITGLAIFLVHNYKLRQALNVVIPEIEKYVAERNYYAAFNLLEKSERYISKSPGYSDLVSRVTTKMTILSDPPGADVYIREYSDTTGKWKNLGITPIDSTRMPNVSYYTTGFTAFVVKFVKEGYEDVIAVTLTKPDTLFRKLFKVGTIPEEMVYVEGLTEEESGKFLNEKHGFFLDRYEVTNKQYKEFVDKGGYSNPAYWKYPFIKDGQTLNWEDAMALLTDKTGRPGPSVWEAGDYEEGLDDYPVSGVSWYEAAAYAEYMGKSLPTTYHWSGGAGFYLNYVSRYFNSKIIPVSNFNDKGPERVGKFRGINSFGAYDMAGNVREWCFNETKMGRIIRGGAWDDASYMYNNLSLLPAIDRSPKNGFRCVQYIDKEEIPEFAFQSISFTESRNYYKEIPVSDQIFRIYKNQFQYDKKSLNSKVEEKYEPPKDYTVEKITYSPSYGTDQAIAYLFLPKTSVPPFQTIIFFPGSAAQGEINLLTSEYTTWYVDFLAKNGRAVMFPVYSGIYERKIPLDFDLLSHQNTEWVIDLVKDFSRSIDYLETRTDIDTGKLAYFGVSWGGRLGAIIPAVERRLRISILIKGGFSVEKLNPEIDENNYIGRISIPVLMLNGRYDATFPLETNVKPFFDLLGTPGKDKMLLTYDTDHNIPKDQMIKETLNWLDKYFGPVRKQ